MNFEKDLLLRISASREFPFRKTVKWPSGNDSLENYENYIQKEKVKPMRKLQILNSIIDDTGLKLPRRAKDRKNSFERPYACFNYSHQALGSLEFSCCQSRTSHSNFTAELLISTLKGELKITLGERNRSTANETCTSSFHSLP